MNKTTLVIDVSNLAWRAYHTTGGLKQGNNPTGVVFGVLKAIQSLSYDHMASSIAFCFDGKKLKRKKLLPQYKANRTEKTFTEEEQEAYKGITKQIKLLRTRYLPRIGYKNIFWDDEYEADDFIAEVTNTVLDQDGKSKVIIVSSDKDLYQLLDEDNSCTLWLPTKKIMYTYESFRKEYKIHPMYWYQVKSIAGCTSDNIPGIKGIGEKTAIAYLRYELKGKKLRDIDNNFDFICDNEKLVKLPFEGCPEIIMVPDEVTSSKWNKTVSDLGMNSLVGKPPNILK